jgi:transketolase
MTRAYDFIRMAAISQANIRLSGSHAGVSIGEDGPSQMALEDLAMMRAVFGSTVLYPCDANQTARLVALMADLEGISYIRTTREKTPILYSDRLDEFRVGGSRIVRGGGKDDQVVIIAAGITVHEAVKAIDSLNDSHKVRLIDLYSIKPLDYKALKDAIETTNGNIIVVEDHWPEGGIGDAVLAAVAEAGDSDMVVHFTHLAPRKMPGSGKPAELLAAAGIDAEAIAAAVKEFAA